MQEKIVETKNCKHCNTSFEITDKDLEFYDKVSPSFGGKKYSIPTPTLCPDCRQQRRLSFRNERKLYKRKCDATGKEIISIYSPDKSYKVYNQDEWWSDRWNSLDYGKEFDFNKLFFEQFQKLFDKVPKLSLFQKDNENSVYSHYEAYQKNCYMTIGGHWSENNMYVTFGIKSNNILDAFWVFDSSFSYEIIFCYNVYNCRYLQYSNDCNNCFFGYELKGCKYCIGCVSLKNKEYSILNKSYTKEEYFLELEKLNLTNYKNIQNFKKEFEKLKLTIPHKNLNILNSQNSIGTDIFNSKNIRNGFLVDDAEDCKNVLVFGWGKTVMDYDFGGDIEKSYEIIASGMKSYNVLFGIVSYENKYILYCTDCHNSSNLFGCIGLRNKSYCILNKQYSKEEYEELVPKIIEHMQKTGEWGEFFPSSISPFGYNETVAQEYFPLSQESAVKSGFNWSDYESPFPKVEKLIQASKLPDNIKDIPDDILNWAIECEVTKKPFRIIKQELEFYRKHNLPIPRRHPDQRHLDRMALRNPRKLFDRKCDKCQIDMKTTYAPERPEIVYCEECYVGEVY